MERAKRRAAQLSQQVVASEGALLGCEGCMHLAVAVPMQSNHHLAICETSYRGLQPIPHPPTPDYSCHGGLHGLLTSKPQPRLTFFACCCCDRLPRGRSICRSAQQFRRPARQGQSLFGRLRIRLCGCDGCQGFGPTISWMPEP